VTVVRSLRAGVLFVVLLSCDAASAPVATAEVARLNRWASEQGLRDDIELWARRAYPEDFPQPSIKSVNVAYAPGAKPEQATVTVIDERLSDDSVYGEKLVFRFFREACAACPDRLGPWTLRELRISWRCQEGRGHTRYSAGRCS
jgi:hypothetical protein